MVVGLLTVGIVLAMLGPGNELSAPAHASDTATGVAGCDASGPTTVVGRFRAIALWWRTSTRGCAGDFPGTLPDGGSGALGELASAMARLDAATDTAVGLWDTSGAGDADLRLVTMFVVCATIPVAPQIAARVSRLQD